MGKLQQIVRFARMAAGLRRGVRVGQVVDLMRRSGKISTFGAVWMIFKLAYRWFGWYQKKHGKLVVTPVISERQRARLERRHARSLARSSKAGQFTV